MCRFATTCVQPATTTTPHATPNSLHIRQAHCYIARLGNISNPREGRVLQLVRARYVSINCVPIEQAEQGYNMSSRALHGPSFRSRSQTLASLQRNARNLPARERKVAESRAMRDLASREPMPKLQARHAKERQRNWEPIARKEKAHVPLVL